MLRKVYNWGCIANSMAMMAIFIVFRCSVTLNNTTFHYLLRFQDSVGVWTIGWGTTVYPNGVKVKNGDKITQAQAQTYLEFEVMGPTDLK